MKLTVVHLEGSKQGQTEYLPGPVVAIGRDPASNQLAFDPYKDLDVSSNHATVTFQGDQVMLQDLGSRNGTFLNGARVNGAVPLPNDSVVQFGDKGPKVKLTYVFHAGPGKKTQMIQDLAGKLEASEQEQKKARADAEAAAAKGKSRTILLTGCFLFLAVIGIVVFVVASKISEKKKLQADIATLKTDVPAARTNAEGKGASTTASAKADWDAALAALTAAEEAEKAEDWATAKAKYEEAQKKFGAAGEAALVAQLSEFRKREEEAQARADAAARKAADDQAAAQRAIKEAERREEERIAALIQRLNDRNALEDNLRQMQNSTNPDELRGAVDALKKALEANPDDPKLKEQLAKFEQQLARANSAGDLLVKAASEAKPRVVGVRARVFAIPRGQRRDTTQIRVPIATSHGTGFFVSASGHVVTAKEVIEPQNFDPAALALQTKLAEKGMQVLTDIEVLCLSATTAGIYTTTYAGDKVTVARRFPDSIGPEQAVTITFDNQQVEVKVRPHRRDDTDIVILKVEGAPADQPFIPLGNEASQGLPVVILGTQAGGEGLQPDQVGLFLFQGKVTSPGRRLECDAPSLRTWLGGPIIDADGKCVGVLIGEGTEKSQGLSPQAFKSELEAVSK